MSKLDEIIKRTCPNGVDFKKLSDVLISIHSGLNPRQNFKLNTNDAKNYYVTVKEITTGKICFSDRTDKINDDAIKIIQKRSELAKDDILLSGIGTIGKVAIVDIETSNWNCSESVLLLKPNKKKIFPKYLKYVLESSQIQSKFNGKAVGSTLKGIRVDNLRNLEIPIPDMEAQCEIVRILDNFAELTAELTAELSFRKSQYDFYNNLIINSFGNHSDFKVDDCISYEHSSKYCVKSTEYSNEYKIPVLTAGQSFILGFTNETDNIFKASKENPVIIFDDFTTATKWVDFDFKVKSSAMKILRAKEGFDLKYMYYLMRNLNFVPGQHARQWISTYSQIKVKVPPYEEQARITKTLDNFYNYISDINEGLPAEIKYRQQQYEYYRDKLLTFKRLES